MIAGAGAFSQKDGRKRKTIIENGSNQEISPTERGGRTYPKTRNAVSKQSAGGEGKNAGSIAGRPKAVNQGGDLSPKNPE
ncbi:hypothetical protein TNCV_1677821 [Trichonephila clavipes]|nr:hypothetical protein TNCV_1677821 [Trichonephila clavipes]